VRARARSSTISRFDDISTFYHPFIIIPGPSPLNSREGSAIVWTGTELIAWSGTVYERFNPTPADGASLTLRD